MVEKNWRLAIRATPCVQNIDFFVCIFDTIQLAFFWRNEKQTKYYALLSKDDDDHGYMLLRMLPTISDLPFFIGLNEMLMLTFLWYTITGFNSRETSLRFHSGKASIIGKTLFGILLQGQLTLECETGELDESRQDPRSSSRVHAESVAKENSSKFFLLSFIDLFLLSVVPPPPCPSELFHLFFFLSSPSFLRLFSWLWRSHHNITVHPFHFSNWQYEILQMTNYIFFHKFVQKLILEAFFVSFPIHFHFFSTLEDPVRNLEMILSFWPNACLERWQFRRQPLNFYLA